MDLAKNTLANAANRAGIHNPFNREVVSPADQVWLFDNTAYRDSRSGQWTAEFVSCYFSRYSGEEASKTVARIAEILRLAKNDRSREIIAERVQPFLDRIKPGETSEVAFAGDKVLELGPAGSNGIASDLMKLPRDERFTEEQYVVSNAILHKQDRRNITMRTDFAEETGWGVISDIDDTIKITMTRSQFGIVKSTFVDQPTPIKGMPELYAYINKTLSPTWFYLSASPYNLYPFLHGFISHYYPHGTMILRDMSWMNLSTFISTLTFKVYDYKTDRCEKIYDWLPRRQWICVGDSTQKDPETYGEMYRRHPKWVRYIFIHIVEGVDEKGERELNSLERFEKAFVDVPTRIWRTFKDPKELYDEIDEVRHAGLKEDRHKEVRHHDRHQDRHHQSSHSSHSHSHRH